MAGLPGEMSHPFSATSESMHGDQVGDSEELRSHTAAVPSDGHDCSPKFVAGVGLSLPRTQHYGNPSTATVDGSLLSGPTGQDRQPGVGSDETQSSGNSDEETDSLLHQEDDRPASTPQQETKSDHSLPVQGQGQKSKRWSIMRKALVLVIILLVCACIGITVATVKCWSPHTNVANVTRVVSENYTVSLRNLPYDSVTITAEDPNQFHHTVDIYQLSCDAIANRTYHSSSCDSSPVVVSHFTLDNSHYLANGSVVEYIISITSAPRDSVMQIFLFANKEDSGSFMNNDSIPHALFNRSLIVHENGTTFPPMSFSVVADTYIFPDASVSAPMNITVCRNYTLVEYIIPQTYKELCTIRSSRDHCNFTLGTDTCLFAYTHVEEFKQTSQLSLNLQGTREATKPKCCIPLMVAAVLITAILIVLIFVVLVLLYACKCKRFSGTRHGGTAPDTYAFPNQPY